MATNVHPQNGAQVQHSRRVQYCSRADAQNVTAWFTKRVPASCARKLVFGMCCGLVACGGRSELLEDSIQILPAGGPASNDAGSTVWDGVVDAGSPGSPVKPDGAAPPEGGGSPSDAGGLPSTAACLTGGNVFWVDGDPDSYWSYWITGARTVTGGAWSATAVAAYHEYDEATIVIPDAISATTSSWVVELTAFGPSSRTGVFESGTTYSNFVDPPAGSVPGGIGNLIFGTACSALVQTVYLEEFVPSPTPGPPTTGLLTFTAAFSVACPVGPGSDGWLHGCIHYDSRNP
jgi:hypothetical protein